jgi:hypothetical protein
MVKKGILDVERAPGNNIYTVHGPRYGRNTCLLYQESAFAFAFPFL